MPTDARRRVSIADATEPPDGSRIDCSIAVSDPWVTTGSTAVLEATIENAGDRTDRFPPAFYKASSEGCGAKGILLYSTRAPDGPSADYAPPCFGDDDSTEGTRGAGTGSDTVGFTLETPPTSTLQPGERQTETILVVDDPTAEGCVPEGEYRFEETHALAPVPEGEYPREEVRALDEAFVWEWTVVVEDVEGP